MTCVVGPYVVFFDADNAYINKDARKVLDHVSENADACGYGRTLLSGHTDTKEQSTLARKRVEVVRAYLTAHGIPEADISEKAFGAQHQRIRTGPNVAERQNRRVEILISQP
jgi:outer membrane protein OmpA-like peptidoglycan-associated protein